MSSIKVTSLTPGTVAETDYCTEDGKELISKGVTISQNHLDILHRRNIFELYKKGFQEDDEIKRILNIPQKLKPVALITVGFPREYEKPTKTSRIPFENITYIDKYGEAFPWVHDYGSDWKYKLEPLEKHIEKIKKRLSEKEK